jgi:uncharacterized membrane protein YhaH (DUF805 family)
MKWYIKVLKMYAVFTGRASRTEYWYFVLFNVIFAIIANVLSRATGIAIIGVIYSLAVLIPGIAAGVRRMHDVNKSGWFLLIPIYNLVLACTPGTEGPNEYGPDPLRPEYDTFLKEEPVA